VKVLEEASNNTSEENQMLVKKIYELDSRLQALEAKAAPSEALMIEKVKVLHDIFSGNSDFFHDGCMFDLLILVICCLIYLFLHNNLSVYM
jgi:hypothetical protein